MNILVTGASGFIGTHLIRCLSTRGDVVTCITRNKKKHTNKKNIFWASWVEIDEGFIKSKEIDVVIHLATSYGRDGSLFDVEYGNVYLPLNLLELCAKLSVPFLNTDTFFSKDEFNCGYMRPYVISKKMFLSWSELICARYQHAKFINMRLEHVYGPLDSKDKFVSFIIKELAIAGNTIECTEGTHARDFIHVSDVVSAYTTILDNLVKINHGCNEYQVGTGVSMKIRDFVEILKKSMIADDVKIEFGAIKMRDDEIMDSKADIEELEMLGWHARLSIESGVLDLVNAAKLSN